MPSWHRQLEPQLPSQCSPVAHCTLVFRRMFVPFFKASHQNRPFSQAFSQVSGWPMPICICLCVQKTTAMIHHVVRLCFVCICDAPSGPSAAEQRRLTVAANTVPAEIANLKCKNRSSFINLYVFCVVHNRMPRSKETYMNKNLGAWAVYIAKAQHNKQLSLEQLVALTRVPHWPIAVVLPGAAKPAATLVPRQALAPAPAQVKVKAVQPAPAAPVIPVQPRSTRSASSRY